MVELRRTMLYVEGGSKILTADTIWHEDEWWLVSKWNVNSDTGMKQPARMIALAQLNPKPSTLADHDWTVWKPLSTDLLDGPGLPDKFSGFRVLILPDLWIEVSGTH